MRLMAALMAAVALLAGCTAAGDSPAHPVYAHCI
jgi:hypothetical protein